MNKEEKKVKSENVCLAKEEISIEKIIDPKKYSTLDKLLKVTSICLQFISMCRGEKEDENIGIVHHIIHL